MRRRNRVAHPGAIEQVGDWYVAPGERSDDPARDMICTFFEETERKDGSGTVDTEIDVEPWQSLPYVEPWESLPHRAQVWRIFWVLLGILTTVVPLLAWLVSLLKES